MMAYIGVYLHIHIQIHAQHNYSCTLSNGKNLHHTKDDVNHQHVFTCHDKRPLLFLVIWIESILFTTQLYSPFTVQL